MKLDWSKVSSTELWMASMQVIHTCRMCGKCCTGMAGIAYNVIDAERMAKHLGMKRNDWMREYTVPSTKKEGDRWLKLVGQEQKCPWLTDHGCSQYEGRGQVCRFYPWYSPEQITRARSGKSTVLYPTCPGMLDIFIKVSDDAGMMPRSAAEQIMKSDMGKYSLLHMIEGEGKGEAAKFAAKELGLEDVIPMDRLVNIARAYATAYLAMWTPQARENSRMIAETQLELWENEHETSN